MTAHRRYCGSQDHVISRRNFLGAAAGSLAVGLPGLGAVQQPVIANELKKQQKRVIMLWLAGGSSQLETWDPVQRRHSIGGPRALAFSPDGALLAIGGMGKVGNIDHLEGKARVEDWQKSQRTHEFPGDKFNGLVEQLTFHPKGDWLLAGDGFLMFFDLKEKKVLRQEKASIHIHAFALNEDADSLVAVGHGKVLLYELKG